MSTPTRRWLAILGCVAVPLAVFVVGTRGQGPKQALDPSYPPSCTALVRLVQTGQADKAREDAKALAAAKDATVEEQQCARRALENLADPFGDPCRVGQALRDRGARGAAAGAWEVGAAHRDPATAECSEKALAALGPVGEEPSCTAVGRVLATGATKAATDAITVALAAGATKAADARCLAAARQAVLALTAPPQVVRPPDLLGELHESCTRAADLAAEGKIEEARRAYEDHRDGNAKPEDRACAVGGLQRLPGRQTFADWSFDRVSRAVLWLSQRLQIGDIALSPGSTALVGNLAWLFTIGLLLVAFRQLLRWRREREPGSVRIEAVDVPGDEKVPVAELLRETLNGAGVTPLSDKPYIGQVSIDIVDIVAGAGETGLVGRFVGALAKAAAVETGVVLRAAADTDAKADLPSALVVQLDDVASGLTLSIETYRGANLRDAVVNAAYGVYLTLSNRDEVVRRTPSFLRWTSISGLRAYQEGREAAADGNWEQALDRYRTAAATELGNLTLHLAASEAYAQRAKESTADKQLPFKAALAAARAVQLNGYSVSAHSRLGLALFGLRGCQQNWGGVDGEDKQALGHLLGFDDVLPPDVELLRLADKAWRRAVRRTWWPVVVYQALWLSRRRTVAGQVRPFSRKRPALHDAVLAGAVGTGYDVLGKAPPSSLATTFDLARLRMALWRVRFGRLAGLRRSRPQEETVQYNLAAAYARRAVYRTGQGKAGGPSRRRALDHLDQAFFGPGQDIEPADIRYLEQDSDFEEFVTSDEYRRWKARFRDKPKDQWSAGFTALAAQSEAARRWWADHRIKPVPRPWLGDLSTWGQAAATWAETVVGWFGDEVERLEALHGWLGDGTSAKRRQAFEKAVGSPPLNHSRPIPKPASVNIEPKDATKAEDSWNKAAGPVAAALVDARAALERVVGLAEAHDLGALRRRVPVYAERAAQRWKEIGRWAADPIAGPLDFED